MFNIQSTCFILALFVRDDGERFLLGDGMYEFADKQLHFAPNSIQSDIVELQGSDGQLLAGQVMRSSKQTFEGIIGDQTTSRTDIENARRRFINFFKTNKKYQVIYVLPDGRSITRYKGFIVEAPSAQELYQLTPKYSVSLMFEELPYYAYAEDDEGNPDFTDKFLLQRSTQTQVLSGGLKWDANGVVWQGAPILSINLCDEPYNIEWHPTSSTSSTATISGGYGKIHATLHKATAGTATAVVFMSPDAGIPMSSNTLSQGSTFTVSIYSDATTPTDWTFRTYAKRTTVNSWSYYGNWAFIGTQESPAVYTGRLSAVEGDYEFFIQMRKNSLVGGDPASEVNIWYQIEVGDTAHPWQSGEPLPPSDDKGAEWEEATIVEGESHINKLDLFTTEGNPVIPSLRLSAGTYGNLMVKNLTNGTSIRLARTFTQDRTNDYQGSWYGFQLEQGINEIVMTADTFDGSAQLVWNSGVVG